MGKAAIIDGKEIPQVKRLGTTWYRRGYVYWLRRSWNTFVYLVILAIITAVSSALFGGFLAAAKGSAAFLTVVLFVYCTFTAYGIWFGYLMFWALSAQKRDHHTNADRRRWRLVSRTGKVVDPVFSSVWSVPIAFVLFFLGGGCLTAYFAWLMLASLQKYTSPAEYAAVRAIQGLPPIDYESLLGSQSHGSEKPVKKTEDKPPKVALLGRSWAKRGAWYWTRRTLWTAFFIWIFYLAARLCAEALWMCAQGQWLQNRALAVGLALLPVAWGLYIGGRSLLTFRQIVHEGRDSRPDEERGLRWVSEQVRGGGGVGGLLMFWYWCHDPQAAIMHGGRGSSRHFGMFLLLFVVGIALVWVIACFQRHFGPEEYDAIRTAKYLADYDARVDAIHESFEQTPAEREYRRDGAWQRPGE